MRLAPITKADVISKSAKLPSFPRIVTEILATLDDPESNLRDLCDYITHDPVIAARVLSQANRAAYGSRSTIRDIYTAASLIGMAQIREISLLSSMAMFVNGTHEYMPDSYWKHSVAVGVSAHELALHISAPIFSEMALITGLLHDIGQLWLHRFCPQAFADAIQFAFVESVGIEVAEREQFGVDHAQIGAWLAENWQLPANIVAAIRHHHRPEARLNELLVPVVSVAEVLTNALDIGAPLENRVTTLSRAACTVLGLEIDGTLQPLLGRMEARSTYANNVFTRHVGSFGNSSPRTV